MPSRQVDQVLDGQNVSQDFAIHARPGQVLAIRAKGDPGQESVVAREREPLLVT
jgi:hypothetical protein